MNRLMNRHPKHMSLIGDMLFSFYILNTVCNQNLIRHEGRL